MEVMGYFAVTCGDAGYSFMPLGTVWVSGPRGSLGKPVPVDSVTRPL